MARVLFATIADPEYLSGGNAIRDHFMIAALSRDHEVVVIAPSAAPSTAAFRPLNAHKVTYQGAHRVSALARGLQPGRLYHSEWMMRPTSDALQTAAKHGPFTHYWSSMLYPAISPIRRIVAPKAQLIWDTHNNDLEVFEGFVRAGGPRGMYARSQYGDVLNHMRAVGSAARGVVACTEDDRTSLQTLLGRCDVVLAQNGVDCTEWFAPSTPWPLESPVQFIVFGSLFASGNTSRGLIQFLRHDWPTVLRTIPGSTLTIAGSNPGAELTRMANVIPNVTMASNPERMAELVRRHSCILVPQYAGHGSKIKMMESIASGLPIVATRQACVGLPGDMARHMSIVDNDDWVGAIERIPAPRELERAKVIQSLDWRINLAPAAALVD